MSILSRLDSLAKEAADKGYLDIVTNRPLFASLVSCVLSKRVRFKQGQKARACLYQHCKTNDVTPEMILSPDCPLKHETLKQAALLFQEKSPTDAQLLEIHGIGSWTLLGCHLMSGNDPDIWLTQDKFIGSRLRLLGTMAKEVRSYFRGRRSTISRFLWRLSDEGCRKILLGQEMHRDWFL